VAEIVGGVTGAKIERNSNDLRLSLGELSSRKHKALGSFVRATEHRMRQSTPVSISHDHALPRVALVGRAGERRLRVPARRFVGSIGFGVLSHIRPSDGLILVCMPRL